MKHFRTMFAASLAALAITTCSVPSVLAQGFQKDKIYVGPTIGFGIGNSLGFGANFEYGITKNIGLGLDLGYSSFSEDFGGTAFGGAGLPEFKYTLIAALASGVYHFTPKEEFDPFIKLGVGYINWDVKYIVDGKESKSLVPASYSSGIAFSGQIGARYEFSPSINGRLALGYPFYVSTGVDFTFGGKDSRSSSRTSGSSKDGGKDGKYRLYVGPYIHAKGSVNTSTAEGWQTGPAFNSVPDFGVTVMAPFGKESAIGLQLDLGHSSLAYQLKPQDRDFQSDSTNFIESYRYFNVSPAFNFSGFVIGANFSMPIGASMESERGQTANPIHNLTHLEKISIDYVDSLASITEVFIGGRIPLVNERSGKLTFDIQLSYSLTGLFSDHKTYAYAYEKNKDGIMKAVESLNPKPAAVKMGLSYLFGIGL